MLSVVTEEGFSKDVKREQRVLLDAGCDVETITLTQARKQELCFTCKL